MLNQVAKGKQLKYNGKRKEKPGYLDCNCFDEGYAVGPRFNTQVNPKYGVLSNEGDKLLVYECPKPKGRASYSRSKQKDSTINQFKHYIKQTLISNLSIEQIIHGLDMDTTNSIFSFIKQIDETLNSYSLNEIALKVLSLIHI